MSVSLLTGCAANSSIKEGSTIDDFISDINGKELGLLLKKEHESVLFDFQSGKTDKDYGLVGVRVAFEPAAQYCRRDQGFLIAEDKEKIDRFMLPTKISCIKNNSAIWSIKPNYSDYRVAFVDFSDVYVFHVTLNPVRYDSEPSEVINREDVKPQLYQESLAGVRNNNYGDMAILNYCLDYPTPVYKGCRDFAEKVRTDEGYEWRMFQSLDLPVSQKKARDESKKYNNTVLVEDRELLGIAKKSYFQNLKSPWLRVTWI